MPDKRGRQREGGGSGGSGGSGSGASKKSKRVMDASGQTVEERRQLRLEQRNLRSVIIEQQANLGDLNKNTCRELTEENGKLFEQTNFPREAVTDGENMKLIAEGAAAQAKKVNTGAVGVDVDDFMVRVKEIFSKSSNSGDDGGAASPFNWSKWGANVSMVYLALPDGGGFMMGPLDKPAKERKAAQRREKIVDDFKEVRPDVDGGKGKKVKQNKDQTQTRIANMKEAEKHSDSFNSNQDMFETFINPKSFTQTVENIFDFSFFVKSGEGHISIDEETKLPQAKFTHILSGEDNAPPQKSQQWLMSFTKADFDELKELYNMEGSHIPHRNDGPRSDYYDPLRDGNRESNRQ